MGLYGGFQEIVRNESDTVSTTSKILSPVRFTSPKRSVVSIRNTSPNAVDIISLSFGNTQAEAGKGIVLRQNEAYIDSSSEGYEPFQGQINAICATVNGTVAIFER